MEQLRLAASGAKNKRILIHRQDLAEIAIYRQAVMIRHITAFKNTRNKLQLTAGSFYSGKNIFLRTHYRFALFGQPVRSIPEFFKCQAGSDKRHFKIVVIRF